MPRNMSFSLTTEQVRQGTKTVTRRLGWWFLKPGDVLWACEKCMGLKRGEKVKRIRPIRVVDVRPEALGDMPKSDCAKEGFPGMGLAEFIAFHGRHMRSGPETIVNRIEFEYIELCAICGEPKPAHYTDEAIRLKCYEKMGEGEKNVETDC